MVQDTVAGEVRQAFDLKVLLTAPNRAPVFQTQPRTQDGVGMPYVYFARAFDADGDPLTYELRTAPSGMILGAQPAAPNTAVLQWTPAPTQLGSHPMVLTVNDGRPDGVVTQEFAIVVTSALDNSAPVIASTPPTTATLDQLYQYDALAEDPDHDSVNWTLVEAPRGLSLDPLLGTMRWTPDVDQLGTHTVTVTATDPYLAAGTQTYEIVVNAVNRPPQISSVPPVSAQTGAPYLYAPRATDPDNDPLAWAFGGPVPDGMTVDPATGLVRWAPQAAQTGVHVIRLRVEDGQGGSDVQQYSLNAADLKANHPPVITSVASSFAGTERPYAYRVKATDVDGDALTLQLLAQPAGVVLEPISSANGLTEAFVRWTPTTAQIGSHEFILSARDPAGASAGQRFSVRVRPNLPPQISSTPPANAVPGLEWRYDVVASDPDGDAVTYRLVTAPAGLAMDPLGRLVWTPTAGQTGSHPVIVEVSDAYALTVTQAFGVSVVADLDPPTVTMDVAYNLVDQDGKGHVRVGSVIGIRVRAADNVGVAARSLEIGGAPALLAGDSTAQVSFPQAGVFEAVATAADASGNTASITNLVPVVDPDALSSVSIVIHSPTNDTEVLKPASVFATIVSSNVPLGEIVLDYAELTSEAAATMSLTHPSLTYIRLTNFVVAPSTYTLSQVNLGRFNPAILQNGAYLLRVSAYDINRKGQQEAALVNVNGNLKFGELRLAFTDLSVPVAGIPITVTRVYDTRDAYRRGDFGYGWSLGVQSSRIRESFKKPFHGFGMEESTFTIQTRVFLNTPDGRRVGFRFTPQFAGAALIFGAFYRPAFTAESGVFEKLEPLDASGAWQIAGDGSLVGLFGLVGYDPTGYRLVTKDGTRYLYDEQAGLQNVTDLHGNRLVFTRDGIFHYSAGSSTPDQQVPFIRDAQGRITEIIDPAGKRLTYAYDTRGDLRSFTDPVSNVTHYLYDTTRAHYLTNIIDSLGRDALRPQYDATGRLVGIRDALGNVTSQDFPDPNTAVFNDANGHTNIVRHDDNGNEVMKVIPGISTNYAEFDASNNLIKSTDARGFVSTRAYDSRGNLTNIVDALSNVTAIAYNDQNKPTRVTDALGRNTQFGYDARGGLTNVVNALGGQAAFTRDAQGRVTSVTDFNGHTTSYDYTGGCSCGKPGKVINPDGTFRLYEYNAQGQTTREVNELGHETVYHYDDAGRLLWVRDAEGNTTRYTYAAALKTSETDPLGRTTWYAYDDANRQIAITNAMGAVVRFEYDQGTNRTAVIDPVGNVTRFYYDAANRLSHQVDPWGRTNFFAYDPAGNRVEAIDRNGRKRTFDYDELNRRTQEQWWDGASLVRTITFGFNALGVMTSASDPASHLEFDFDALNRLERATQSGVPGLADFTLTYGYDGLANVTAVTDNWGVQVASQYDSRNHLTKRVWQGGELPGASLTFDYDAAGNRTNLLRFADASATQLVGQSRYGYSPVGVITDILHANAAGTALAEYHYTRDPAQQIVARTIGDQLSSFGYDLTGQLTNAVYTPPTQPDEAYRYDANGNRIGGGYVVITNNQIIADGTNTYSYDLEGSMVGRSNSVTHSITTYRYDHRNRLVSVVDKDSGGTVAQTVEFTYDALNRRTVTRLLLNQENIWADADAAGVITARYLLGNRVDEMLARYRVGEAVVWYLTDNLGTVRDLADSTGAVVNHVSFDSFGRILAQTAAAVGDRFLFTGRELDGETGLFFYRARYYSPDIGRFVSEDPVGFKENEFGLYGYAANDPLSSLDPHGTATLVERVMVSAVLGTVVGAHVGVLCWYFDPDHKPSSFLGPVIVGALFGALLPMSASAFEAIEAGGPSLQLLYQQTVAVAKSALGCAPTWKEFLKWVDRVFGYKPKN